MGAPSAASSCVLTGHHTGEEPCSWPGGPGPVTLTGSFVIYETTEQRGEPRVPGSTAREAAAASGTDRVSSACGQLGVRGQDRRAGASSPNCPGPQCHGSGHGGTDGRGQWPGGPRAPSLTAQRHPQPSPLGGCGQPPLRAPGGQDAPAPQAWLSLPTPRPRAVGEWAKAPASTRCLPRARSRSAPPPTPQAARGTPAGPCREPLRAGSSACGSKRGATAAAGTCRPHATHTHGRLGHARQRAEQRPNKRVTYRCPHSLHGRENREHVTSAVTATHTRATAGSAQAALSWPPSGLLLEGFTPGAPKAPRPFPRPWALGPRPTLKTPGNPLTLPQDQGLWNGDNPGPLRTARPHCAPRHLCQSRGVSVKATGPGPTSTICQSKLGVPAHPEALASHHCETRREQTSRLHRRPAARPWAASPAVALGPVPWPPSPQPCADCPATGSEGSCGPRGPTLTASG